MLGNAGAVVVLRVEPFRRGCGGAAATADGGGRSCADEPLAAAGLRARTARTLGHGSRGTAASRCAASIRASAIHRAMRSTSRSGRPQMSFRIMYGSMP